jgi:hypothetical protein
VVALNVAKDYVFEALIARVLRRNLQALWRSAPPGNLTKLFPVGIKPVLILRRIQIAWGHRNIVFDAARIEENHGWSRRYAE